MLKHEEMSDPTSCLNKAADDEIIFVVLEQDDAAPDTIRFWVNKRIELGKNKPSDRKMTSALELADLIEQRKAAVKRCSWCPQPDSPSPQHHPDGQAEHVP